MQSVLKKLDDTLTPFGYALIYATPTKGKGVRLSYKLNGITIYIEINDENIQ